MANMEFGKLIKNLREKNNLTMQELADMLGVSKSSVNMWENAGVIPREPILKELSYTFKVSIDYLLGNITKDLEIKTKNMAIEINEKLLKFMNKMSEDDLELFLFLIELAFAEESLDGSELIKNNIRQKYDFYKRFKDGFDSVNFQELMENVIDNDNND